MEISIPCDCSQMLYLEHNVDDFTTAYDPTKQRSYETGDILQDQDIIWEHVGDTFTPITWNEQDETNEVYLEGDILYKDGTTVLTNSLDRVAQQPEVYPIDPSLWFYDLWAERYTRLMTSGADTAVNTLFWNQPVGEALHSLYRDSTSSTDWRYRTSYPTLEDIWSDDLYYATPESSWTFIVYTPSTTNIKLYWYGTLLIDHNLNTKDDYVTGSVIVVGDTLYKSVRYIGESSEGYYEYYSVSVLEEKVVWATEYAEAYVAHESTLIKFEEEAVSVGTPSMDVWVGRHFIIRGTELYMRTWVDIPQIDLPSTEKYLTLDTIEMFPSGFANIGVVNYKKPFDGKKYTNVSQRVTSDVPLRYLLETANPYDTVAMAGVIANDIEIKFWLPDADYVNDTPVAHIESYVPRNYRDETLMSDGETLENRLPAYPTTAILYCIADEPMPEGSTIEIFFKGLDINIGTIMFGLSVNAGFTNLEFTTKFIDRSPKEVDQWGNVVYVTTDSSGTTVDVKQLTWTGTVDIPITKFDMTTRLMTSMGASTLILNGSDGKDNTPPNNLDVFASTMLIGRLKDFQLKTKLKNKRLDEMATYSLTIEEDI